jgi:predicted metalloprotease with PDZ domain
MHAFNLLHRVTGILALALAISGPCAFAQNAGKNMAPAKDTPYGGTIGLHVDLTDLERKVMQVRETIPVKSGPLTLFYPRWLPGNHSPHGSVSKLAGLHITAHGKPLEWTRDTVDMYAFHLQVPSGATQLDLSYQYLSPVSAATGRVVMTPEIIGLQWNTVVLYPAGYFSSAMQIKAAARVPHGWQSASALDIAARNGEEIEFKPTTLERLIDSPLWAGKHTKRIVLDDSTKAPVYLNVFADTPAALEASEDHIKAHQQLVKQADATFASRHFARYEFLLAISDQFTGIGLEHAESSENGVRPGYFTEWKKDSGARTLLPHEFTHSWNGKFRRPADLWTPDYNTPMQDSLLWIYEGQTQYWGYVLATRSGLVPIADALDSLAAVAASLESRAGRTWRNLQDTTNEPIVNQRAAQDWSDWQRREEYYNEGQLIWLDVDTKIRELTKGNKSLNDVARAFFGTQDGRVTALTYTLEDYVKLLNAAAPWDWATFLRRRLDTHESTTILDGITRGGWKLVFTDKQSEGAKAREGSDRSTDYTHSIGLSLDREGKITSVKWEGPAFKAGLTNTAQVIAVQGIAYKPENLRDAIARAKDGSGVEVLVKSGNLYKTVKIDYRDGLRYPKLERLDGAPDLLTEILTAVK